MRKNGKQTKEEKRYIKLKRKNGKQTKDEKR